MRVVVVGSSNTDLVLQTSRLPAPGETVLGGDFQRWPGGKGANQAVAAARAGAQVFFIGAHGPDEFGREARNALRAEGINVRFFREKPACSSGVALILVGGRARQNLIGVARSANDLLTAADVFAAESMVRRADVILAQLEVSMAAVTAAAELAHRFGIPFILNPAPARALPRALLGRTHTLIPNEHEAQTLLAQRKLGAKRLSPPQLCRALQEKSGCTVVVTLGERGVIGSDGQRMIRVRAPRVKPVDTVGAGDCFCGWFAAGIAEGLPLEATMQRAVQASALAVTRAGAQAGMPRRAELGLAAVRDTRSL